MEELIKDKDYRATQSLICQYIDADIKEQEEELISLYKNLTRDNAEESYDKAYKLIFRPIVYKSEDSNMTKLFITFSLLILVFYVVLSFVY